MVKFCRDCANFEERRDLDGTALCKKKIGPYICCEDFEIRDLVLNSDRLYHRFCVECLNFQEINETPTCGRGHVPGIACQEFTSRLRRLNVTRQNNHMKTALIVHAAKENRCPELVPAFLIEISSKIKW